MGKKEQLQSEPHYYSDRLLKKLAGLRAVPTTIVEAPPGYGKTTAIRDYLENVLPRNIPVHSFTATDELPAACFRRFSREIDKIDGHVGQRLLKIGFPGPVTIGEACDALRSIRCHHETYLVIDNFQYLHNALPPSFFTALIEHGVKRLHVILLTHMLKRNVFSAILGYGFLHVTAADLRLHAGDIRRYYSLAGVNITPEAAEDVASYTGGWIIAVYLQLRAFREKGSFSVTQDILTLMEHLVWDKLTPGQQDFLLRLSPLETATMRQMCVLLDCEVLPDYALDALEIPFIRCEPAGRRYELHSILHSLVAQKCHERGESFERECLLRAGDLCRDDGMTPEALGFYWRLRDYERMLALDLSHLILEQIGGTPFSALALDIAQHCPAEIKRKYPLSMLCVAWALLTAGMSAEFDVLMEELRSTLGTENDADGLLGEWMLLYSFKSHPRLDEITAVLREAASLFKGTCSRVILPAAPWCFGNCGPLADYHITPGEADRKADALEEYVALYARLTNGHGSGADVLYRAELAYHRGNLNEAEILAYKAAFLAESKQQSIVQLGASLQLAQIALHRADTASWQRAISSMERAASYPAQNSFVVRAALDIMRGMLLTELQQLTGIADWLKNGDFSSSRLLPAMVPPALFVHAVYLLHQGEFARLIGLAGARHADGLRNGPVLTMLLSLTLAAGYMQMGESGQASAFVRRAAQAALPDGLISPFASFSWLTKGLTDEVVEREYPALFEKFQATKERFAMGWTKLYQDLLPAELPGKLTAREREVALLAAQGLRNGEIAEKLSIKENTVRFHLRTIFQKLDVDRRAKLAERLKPL
ncbi:LuxR C-terminal-related transcriptional regulator [Desulfoscipio sp. XC116]|uniref:LuxR C-terminal-related transcriptional regulator n=1 Tax=Desulfoscipio sp. XC116 TaxID=3144975 RepID=UPI00325BAFB0